MKIKVPCINKRDTIIFSHVTDPVAASILKLKQQPRNTLAIGILISLVIFGLTSGHVPLSPAANADAQRMVSLYADGQKRIFATEATTVGEVLRRGNVQLQPGDLVEPALKTVVPKGFFNVNVYRARPVLIQDGFKSYRISSAYQSPRLLSQAAGLTTYPEDHYDMGVITDVVSEGAIGVKVEVKRAAPFVVRADGKTLTLRTQADTVGEALKQAGLQLGIKDTVTEPLNEPLVPGDDLTITRVAEAETSVTQTIPRPVRVINDPTLLKGKREVKTEGADGQKVQLFRIHYRDGAEVSRELIRTLSETESVARVEVVGTKVFFPGSVEYWRPLVEKAAAEYNLDPNMMMRIMSCESKGNATVVSKFNVSGEHPTGLFQYLPSTWRRTGGTDENILDGATQIQLTARKMARDGTGEWQCR